MPAIRPDRTGTDGGSFRGQGPLLREQSRPLAEAWLLFS
ncbi:MAG: hypothetical protein GAK45_01842 [Pseudomonas citronellolis]|nr:MAG: hypothetical protein GAK45_01842 [Pseudomonas citronellolis]